MIVMGSPVGGSENDNFPLGYLMKITLCVTVDSGNSKLDFVTNFVY